MQSTPSLLGKPCCLHSRRLCVRLSAAGGWPFPVIYLILSLFGSTNVGILSASVLLMVSVFAGGADVIVFFLYFISGIFVAALFYCYEGELKIGQPLFLSMLCLLLCETAGIVLTDNTAQFRKLCDPGFQYHNQRYFDGRVYEGVFIHSVLSV